MDTLLILNGPNLNLLGAREPEIYGDSKFETYFEKLQKKYPQIHLEYFQSNIEGEIIDKLQRVGFSYKGIIINAGGYTHTSVAIADTIKAISTPCIEVHISNVLAREDFRRTSLLGAYCIGSISGFGLKSYELGVLGVLG